MPKVSIDISHNLSKSDAQNRVKSYLSKDLKNAVLGLTEVNVHWSEKGADFAFKITAILIKGNLVVDTNFVNITSNIPFVFFPLKGQIEKIIKEQAALILK